MSEYATRQESHEIIKKAFVALVQSQPNNPDLGCSVVFVLLLQALRTCVPPAILRDHLNMLGQHAVDDVEWANLMKMLDETDPEKQAKPSVDTRFSTSLN